MKIIDAVQKYLLAGCMLFTTGLLFVNVVMRYFFHSAIFWTEETLRYLIVWICFIGISSCLQENSHISIDILSQVLKGKKKVMLDIFLQIVGIIFGSVFILITFSFVSTIKTSGQVSATIGNLPMYLVYACLPISFILYVIKSIEMLIKAIRQRPEEAAT